MVRKVIAAAILVAAGAMISTSAAQAYIGEGVQGRPHGGRTASRMLFRRHGLPIPPQFRRGHRPHYNY